MSAYHIHCSRKCAVNEKSFEQLAQSAHDHEMPMGALFVPGLNTPLALPIGGVVHMVLESLGTYP